MDTGRKIRLAHPRFLHPASLKQDSCHANGRRTTACPVYLERTGCHDTLAIRLLKSVLPESAGNNILSFRQIQAEPELRVPSKIKTAPSIRTGMTSFSVTQVSPSSWMTSTHSPARTVSHSSGNTIIPFASVMERRIPDPCSPVVLTVRLPSAFWLRTPR